MAWLHNIIKPRIDEYLKSHPGLTVADVTSKLFRNQSQLRAAVNYLYDPNYFVGTDEEWQAFTAEANRILAERSPPDYKFEPPPYDPRLWAEVPDTELHERATQIFNAWEAYQADLDRYKIEIDIDRLSDLRDELDDQLNELFGKLENLKAVTLDGIRTKAEVVAHCCWLGKVKRDWGSTDHRLAASLISDLTGLPDEEPEPEDDGLVAGRAA